MREHFNETINRLLNKSLSSALLKIKEEILKSKNKSMLDLISNLTNLIEKKINDHYSNYTNSLLSALENIKHVVDKPPEIIITLNSRDFDYFNGNKDKIAKIFKNNIKLKKSDKEFTGGFICMVLTENISYDYTIENQIKKKTSTIEIEFSKIFSESETDIKQLENNYLKIIQDQRNLIDVDLQNYE
jgi:vacuolar-type H+-ATPase subunit E/Vma4